MADNNPYVGPASFSENDRRRFFGRDEEARELSYLLIARQAVLLYAQSGAGKTSLLQAKVVPDLRDSGEMHVLPITRVSGDAKDGNVYVANALSGLNSTRASLNSTPRSLTDASASFFAESQDGEEQVPYLLIIDQFEEIFTFRPELARERLEFFEQLRDCLAAYPNLGLLLSMREDYLADIDSFAGYLPDRLRTRMRMERLSDKQAVEAIANPAAGAGKPFDAGIASRLTDDLRRVQTSRKPSASAADDGHALGKYVEPVQLQIVCRQLWSKLPDDAMTITGKDIETLARVDDALTNFYRDSLTAVREKLPTLSERTLRQWFDEDLITSAKTRGMVHQGQSKLPNTAVEVLREKYILRADNRDSGTWYELAHDRLVEPILAENQVWRDSYKNPVADALKRGSDKLLTGSGLAEAIQYAEENPRELNEKEEALLDRSQEAARKAKTWRIGVIASTVAVIFVLSGVAGWALVQKRAAEESRDSERSTKDFIARVADTLQVLSGVVPEETEALMRKTTEAIITGKVQDADLLTLQQIDALIEMGRYFYDAWDTQRVDQFLKDADERLAKLSTAGAANPEAARLHAAWKELAGDKDALDSRGYEHAEDSYVQALELYPKIGPERELALARVHGKLATLKMLENDYDAADTHVKTANSLLDPSEAALSEEALSERAVLNDLMAVSAMHREDVAKAQRLLEEAVKLDRRVLHDAQQTGGPIQRASVALASHLQHLGDALRRNGNKTASSFYEEAETHANEVLATYPNQDNTRFMLDLIRQGQWLAYRKGLVSTSPAERISTKESALDREFGQGFGRFKFGMSTADVQNLFDHPFTLDQKTLPRVTLDPKTLQRAAEYLSGDVRYLWISISESSDFVDFYNIAPKCLNGLDYVVFLFHEDSLIRISYRLYGQDEPGCRERSGLFPELAERRKMPLLGTPKQWRLQWDTNKVSIIGKMLPEGPKLDIAAR